MNYLFKPENLKIKFQSFVDEQFHIPLTCDSCNVDIFRGVVFKRIKISDKIYIDKINFNYELQELIKGNFEIKGIEIIAITAQWDDVKELVNKIKSGHQPEQKPSGGFLNISNIQIEDILLKYEDVLINIDECKISELKPLKFAFKARIEKYKLKCTSQARLDLTLGQLDSKNEFTVEDKFNGVVNIKTYNFKKFIADGNMNIDSKIECMYNLSIIPAKSIIFINRADVKGVTLSGKIDNLKNPYFDVMANGNNLKIEELLPLLNIKTSFDFFCNFDFNANLKGYLNDLRSTYVTGKFYILDGLLKTEKLKYPVNFISGTIIKKEDFIDCKDILLRYNERPLKLDANILDGKINLRIIAPEIRIEDFIRKTESGNSTNELTSYIVNVNLKCDRLLFSEFVLKNVNTDFVITEKVEGKLKSDSLGIKNICTEEITSDYSIAGQDIKFFNTKAKFYKGNLLANFEIKQDNYDLNISGNKISLYQFYNKNFKQDDERVSADVDFTIHLNSRGINLTNIIRNLNGQGNFSTSDGEITDTKYQNNISIFLQNFDFIKRITFNNIISTFTVSDGKVSISGFNLTGEEQKWNIKGSCDLISKKINLVCEIWILSEAIKSYGGLPQYGYISTKSKTIGEWKVLKLRQFGDIKKLETEFLD